MLHTDAVEKATFQLLRRLAGDDIMAPFALADGTALSLYMGHRKSIGLDLFSQCSFDNERLAHFLHANYDFVTGYMAPDTLKGTIGSVKVDCIAYPYRLLEPVNDADGVRLYGVSDIVAMKLSAIVGNGTRLKDFIDVAYLSTRMSLYAMLQCYERKYEGLNALNPLKALTYFDDIDFNETIVMTGRRYNWEGISHRLESMARDQYKVFDSFPEP